MNSFLNLYQCSIIVSLRAGLPYPGPVIKSRTSAEGKKKKKTGGSFLLYTLSCVVDPLTDLTSPDCPLLARM